MPLQHRRDRAHSPRVVMAPPLRRAISPLVVYRADTSQVLASAARHHGRAEAYETSSPNSDRRLRRCSKQSARENSSLLSPRCCTGKEDAATERDDTAARKAAVNHGDQRCRGTRPPRPPRPRRRREDVAVVGRDRSPPFFVICSTTAIFPVTSPLRQPPSPLWQPCRTSA